MSLAFSRRSFLKYSAVAAVAVAGASLFSGCDQTDTKNLYCDGAGSITVLQINAVLGTYDNDAKKYKDIDLTGTSISFPFQITVGRTNNLPIQPSNFKAIVYGKDGKQKAKYVGGTSSQLLIDASLLDTNLANSVTNSGKITLNASLDEGEKLVFTDAYTEGWKPAPEPFMTALLLLADAPGGGTSYTAIARHRSPATRKAHEDMGFYDGWGTVVTQLEAYARGLGR